MDILNVGTLLKPQAKPANDRRSWGIPVLGVLIPFFTATNAAGETAIAADVLGAPLRLGRDKDGTPKFSQSGKPVVRLAGELTAQVRIMRENFIYGMTRYHTQVVEAMPDAYKAQVEAAQKAGEPIAARDAADLAAALDARAEAQKAEAERVAPKAKAKRDLVPA